MKLSDDWNGADFIALRISGETLLGIYIPITSYSRRSC